MNFKYLNLNIEDRVGWIEYNRPPINAFNWEMLQSCLFGNLKTSIDQRRNYARRDSLPRRSLFQR